MHRALLFGILLAAAPVAADELVGIRALALQGGRASPNDNASIFLNPAGTAIAPRYDFTAFGLLQRGTGNRLVNLSLVDSKTSAQLGGGLGWNRGIGKHLPTDDFAFAVSQKYPLGAFGVGVHYRIDRERERHSDVNADTGFLIDPWEGRFKVAAVTYNAFDPPKKVKNVHRRHTLGLASRWLELFEITADAAYNPGARYRWLDWASGVEITPQENVSFRGGFGQAPAGIFRKNQLSGGFEIMFPNEADIGYTYLLTLGDPQHATHAAEISVLFF